MRILRLSSLSWLVLAGLVAVVTSATAIWLLAPLSVHSAYPGANGRIAFESVGGGDVEIFAMDPDGSGVLQLTFNEAFDGEANYSADGTRIAFSSDRDGAFDTWTMNADGSNATNLTNDSALDFSPDWSPDGTRIAFSSDRNGDYEIYAMDADGGNIDQLTFNDSTDFLPKWSPDGTKIAFEATRDGNGEIYVMDADGGNPTNLTNHSSSDQDPDWSPDGSRIAFMSYRSDIGVVVAGGALDEDIFTMNSSGGDIKQLTNFARNERHPRWSPDGTKIVYSGHADGDPGSEVVVMDASDGANKTNLTDLPSTESANDWQPLVAATPSPTLGPTATPTPPPSATPTPSPPSTLTPTTTPPGGLNATWGDNNCKDGVNPIDSLFVLRSDAGLPTNTGSCPDMGQEIEVLNASPHIWGDVDCTGTMTPVDSLKVLRFDAGLGVSQEANCPEVGSTVTIAES